jgi:hypothetical protein
MESTNNVTEKTEGWSEAIAASAQAEIAAKQDASPPRVLTESLSVKLTDAELVVRAKKAAELKKHIADLEAKKSAAAANWKAQIEIAESERDELLDVVSDGTEFRNVECIEEFLFPNNTVRVTRTDTKEVIRERAMTASERQPSLPLDVKPAKTKAPVAEDTSELSDEERAEMEAANIFEEDENEASITDPASVLGDEAEPPKTSVRRRKKGE